MEVNLIRENPDGSADFTFDMNAEEIKAMVQLGIITALKNAIKEAQDKYDPGFDISEGGTVSEANYGGNDD